MSILILFSLLWIALVFLSGMGVLQLFLRKGLFLKNATWGKALQVVLLQFLAGMVVILANEWWPLWIVGTAWLWFGAWLLRRIYKIPGNKAVLITFVQQLIWILVICALGVGWKQEVGQLWRVQGQLMCPTLNATDSVCRPDNPDIVWVNRRAKTFERGDVVAFQVPGPDAVDVARVVGIGGQTLRFMSGKIYEVQGEDLLEVYEPYLPDDQQGQTHSPIPQLIIGEGTYFLMRDQRTESVDSRLCFSAQGCGEASRQATVTISKIIGRAELILWPGSARQVY